MTSVWSLAHACVAIVAALGGEFVGINTLPLYLVHKNLAT